MNYLSFTELRTPSVAVYDVVNLQRDGWVKVMLSCVYDGITLGKIN